MKNVFVIGLDDHNHEVLLRTPSARTCRFHPLLEVEDIRHGTLDADELVGRAEEILDGFDGSVDAIVGYWDFPVTLLVPILCEPRGLPSARLEAVVKCEHKYWSRLEQRESIDEYPRFGLVDLSGDPAPPPGLKYPMWLKPVKSASSMLAFRVDDDQMFQKAVDKLRGGVDRMGTPFEQILRRLRLPPEIASVGGRACLAEECLHGVQAAVEGCVYGGEVNVYSTLDSVDFPGSAAFLRHQYPSMLPEPVCLRMADVATRFIEHVGLDNSTFSVEFFYDPIDDDLTLLEVNPRHSQSHAELFELVDGVPNHERMIRLGLGLEPRVPNAEGEYEVAGKWFYRRFDDGVVVRVPTAEEVAELESTVPGVSIQLIPAEGQRLSAMTGQDSYSYELAAITIGARNEVEMRAKYERCVESLSPRFTFADEEEPAC